MRTYAADLLDASGNKFAMLYARSKRAIERQITAAAQDHGTPCRVEFYTFYAAERKDGTRDSFLTTSKAYTISK